MHPTTPLPIPTRSFINRNLVAIVMIPTIIGLHYGWDALQENKALVPEGQRQELPVVIFGKYLWQRVTGNKAEKTTSAAEK